MGLADGKGGLMAATGLNHVAVRATDLAESVRFYKEVLGMTELPTFTFPQPVAWLRLGPVQFHLYVRDEPTPVYQHVGIEVDDFESVYTAVCERGITDNAFGYHCYELPDRSVQLYFRDPAGNLIEIDWPDVQALDRTVVDAIRLLTHDFPQASPIPTATLFLDRQR